MQFTFTYVFTHNRVSLWKHIKLKTQKYTYTQVDGRAEHTHWTGRVLLQIKAAASIFCLVHQSFDVFLDTKASVSSYKYNVEKQ